MNQIEMKKTNIPENRKNKKSATSNKEEEYVDISFIFSFFYIMKKLLRNILFTNCMRN